MTTLEVGRGEIYVPQTREGYEPIAYVHNPEPMNSLDKVRWWLRDLRLLCALTPRGYEATSSTTGTYWIKKI